MRQRALALFLALFLAGCTSPVRTRELEQLQLVETLGFDGGLGDLTISVAPAADPEGEAPAPLSARGRSVTEAIDRLRAASPREELFFAHVRFAAVGERAARAGLAPLLDWFARSTQTPLNVPLFVVRGGPAEALVTTVPENGREITARLETLHRAEEARCATLLEAARQLARSGTALTAAVRSSAEGPVFAGSALWKDGALAGFFDEDETQGAQLLRSRVPRRALSLPLGEVARFTVELKGARCRLAAAPEGLRVTARCRAGLVEAEGFGALDESALAAIDAALAEALAGKIAAAIAASQRMDADVLELCRRTGLDAADFPTLPWRVEVTAAVERSYDIDGEGRLAP